MKLEQLEVLYLYVFLKMTFTTNYIEDIFIKATNYLKGKFDKLELSISEINEIVELILKEKSLSEIREKYE